MNRMVFSPVVGLLRPASRSPASSPCYRLRRPTARGMPIIARLPPGSGELASASAAAARSGSVPFSSTRPRSASISPRRMRPDAAPQLRADRAPCGPALVRIVAEHARQRRDWRAGPARRSDRALLPTNSALSTIWFQAARQLLARIRVAMRHRLEHRLHVGANAFRGAQRRDAAGRDTAAGRDRTPPVRRRRRCCKAGRAGARTSRRRVPARAADRRAPPGPALQSRGSQPGRAADACAELRGVSARSRLADLARDQAHRQVQIACRCRTAQRCAAALPATRAASPGSRGVEPLLAAVARASCSCGPPQRLRRSANT